MKGLAKLTTISMAVALGACGSPGSVVLRTQTAALTVDNGVSLNGVSLNGVSLNGVSLNGVSLNGVSLNGVSLNGVSLNGVSLDGSELIGVTSDGSELRGVDMRFSRFVGLLSDGRELDLKIHTVIWGSGSNHDVSYYQLSYASDSGRTPLCGRDDAGHPIRAIALRGRWDHGQGVAGGGGWIDDPSAFTISCVGANLTKCVEIGYKPWKTSAKGHQLRNHHGACVRMMRADYCGDGTSYTVDGTPINLFDDEDIQHDAEPWAKEAEWDANGARCVNHSALRQGSVPSCAYNLPDCASSHSWSQGALLVSEANSSQLSDADD